MSKNPRRPTFLELYKSIRKEPTPPGRTHRRRNRDLAAKADEREITKWKGWKGEAHEEFE